MPDAYLDSSALVKRYIEEPGTLAIDAVFDRAHRNGAIIATSVWNLGEVFGVLDHRRRRNLLNEHDFRRALQDFAAESVGLMRSGSMQVYPLRTSLLTEAWIAILSEHLYESDALQIVTCNASKSRALLTSDERLRKASLALGIKALNPEYEEKEIEGLFDDQRRSEDGRA